MQYRQKVFRRKFDPGAYGIQVQTFGYMASVLCPQFSVRKIRKLKQSPSETGRFLPLANMHVEKCIFKWGTLDRAESTRSL